MKDKKPDNIEQLSDAIADGKQIDWSQHQSDGTDESLKKLQDVENISKAFAKTRMKCSDKSSGQSSEHSSDGNEKALFTWGHLQVLEKIGQGSFGDVFRAYDPVLNREVALKLRRLDKVSAAGNRAFLQEARRLAQIRQRNVIAVHGAATHDEQVGIWTDLLQGQNLKQHFLDQGTINCASAYNLILDIAHALAAVHEAEIVHGDVKSSNIMRQDDGKFVLMDFGAGGELYDVSGSPTTGTPLVMAPELFNGSVASAVSDQYSFGTMLYQILSGEYPYKGQSVIELKQAHTDKRKIPLHKRCPKLSKGLCDLVDGLLSLSPGSRPSAKQVIKKTHWLLNAPKRRKRKLAIASIIASLCIGIIISSWGYFNATREKEKAESMSLFLQDLLSSPSYLSQGKDVKVVDLLSKATKDLDDNFKESEFIKADMYYAIGRSYLILSLAEESIQQFEKSLALKKTIYGKSSVEVQSVLQDIMSAYSIIGDDKQVTAFAKEIIKLAKLNSHTPSYESKIATTMLASQLSNEGKYQESENILKLLLVGFKDSDPSSFKNNDEKYFILVGFYELYSRQSKFKLAETYARKALDWTIKRSPKSHANQIALKANIADLLVKQGKMSEAKVAYQDLLGSSKQFYGEDNRGYLSVLINFGVFLSDNKAYEKAMTIQKDALRIALKNFGDLDETTVSIKINISIILKDTNKLSQAEELMRSTLIDGRKVLGKTHTTVLILELNLADLFNEQKKYQEAEKLAKINSEKFMLKLGKKHVFTLLSQTALARSISYQDRFLEAENLYSEIFADMLDAQGMKGLYTQQVLQNYIVHLLKFNKTTQAKEKLLQLYNAQKESLGEDHTETLESKKQLDELNSSTMD